MKKISNCILFFMLFTIPLHGDEVVSDKNTIWAVMHHNWINGKESDEVFIGDIDYIKNCSHEIKIIIAFYSKYIPLYIFPKEQRNILANALGGFLSLDKAQSTLLQNKETYFSRVVIEELYRYPAILEIEQHENIVSVSFKSTLAKLIRKDTFRIYENGGIEYLFE